MVLQELSPIKSITRARVLVNLGDSVTTDHISPAGSIARNSSAARYLANRGWVWYQWDSGDNVCKLTKFLIMIFSFSAWRQKILILTARVEETTPWWRGAHSLTFVLWINLLVKRDHERSTFQQMKRYICAFSLWFNFSLHTALNI